MLNLRLPNGNQCSRTNDKVDEIVVYEKHLPELAIKNKKRKMVLNNVPCMAYDHSAYLLISLTIKLLRYSTW